MIIEITGHIHFPIHVSNDIIVNTCAASPDVWELEKFQTTKLTFSLIV